MYYQANIEKKSNQQSDCNMFFMSIFEPYFIILIFLCLNFKLLRIVKYRITGV